MTLEFNKIIKFNIPINKSNVFCKLFSNLEDKNETLLINL